MTISPPRTLQLTDPRALRAVAHPLRLELIGLLRRGGPLTATQAAERVGESPASCSFHLRQLAKYGLVEEAGGGQGRERPWQATATTTEWTGRSGPERDDAATMLTRVVAERYFHSMIDWLDRLPSEPPEWADSAVLGDSILYLTPAELAELDQRIQEIFEPYVERLTNPASRPAGSRPVNWVQIAFPFAAEPPES